MAVIQLSSLCSRVVCVAEEAGDLIEKMSRLPLQIKHKQGQGLVSQVDMASEKLIIARLKELLPQASFLAEEDSFLNKRARQSGEWQWVIDPLDGTNNFIAGIPFFCISIALTFKDEPVLGVIYNPVLKDCYKAWKGGGAFMRERNAKRFLRIEKINSSKKLGDCMLATGFNHEKGQETPCEFEAFFEAVQTTRAVRRIGSAALDLAYLAAGVFDGFWEQGLAPWDVAAGTIICQEAGVKVSTFIGEMDIHGRSIIAARPFIYKKLKKALFPILLKKSR